MRKPKSKTPGGFTSPSPKRFDRTPVAELKREATTNYQKNFAENTILYGDDDALPLRISRAVDESPAASACIETIAQFIKGAGFSDKELQKIKIDKNGKTLWDLHCELADSCALFNGFATNLKFNEDSKITNTYIMPFESCRFVKPDDDLDPYITTIKYNPYFGVPYLYQKKFTEEYPVFDLETLKTQIETKGKAYKGQVFYYGKTSPVHRFYPVPKYWSAKKWIDIDGKIQEFHSNNLANGFFQSVLMNVIGDPNQWDKNPKHAKIRTKDDGTKETIYEKTIGESFNDQMSASFSGSQKAGNIMALWSLNADQAVKIAPFPSNNNSQLFDSLQNLTTQNITIATRVPGVLSNISESGALNTNGSEIQKAVELMQSRTVDWRMILMNFYNDVLLPNLEPDLNGKQTPKPGTEVSIVNFNPVTDPVTIDPLMWASLSKTEQRDFIRENFPNTKLGPDEEAPSPLPPTQVQTPADTTIPPDPNAPVVNDALKNMSMQNLNRILSVLKKFETGKVTEAQATQILLGNGITQDQLPAWLHPEEVVTEPITP